jgi:hypothetical protein
MIDKTRLPINDCLDLWDIFTDEEKEMVKNKINMSLFMSFPFSITNYNLESLHKKFGNWSLIKIRLLSHLFPNYSIIIGCICIITQNLNIIEWYYDYFRKFDIVHMELASIISNEPIIQYLHSKDCPWNTSIFSNVVLHGSFEILQWLKSNNCPWDNWFYVNALYARRIDIVKWAYENGCPIDRISLPCALAGEIGDIEFLKWLIERGFRYNYLVLTYAISENHINILEYMRNYENNSLWKFDVLYMAVKTDNIEILNWLFENKVELFYNQTDIEKNMIRIILATKYRAKEWFNQNNVPL